MDVPYSTGEMDVKLLLAGGTPASSVFVGAYGITNSVNSGKIYLRVYDFSCSRLFCRSEMFSLVKSSAVQYRREEVAALCKDNIGLVLVLETGRRESGAASGGSFGAGAGAVCRLVVANTRLLFNTKREELRLGQAALLLAEVEAMSWLSHTQVTSLPTVLLLN